METVHTLDTVEYGFMGTEDYHTISTDPDYLYPTDPPLEVSSVESIIIINVLMNIIYILGLSGNGNVICLLHFHCKRNHFMTYILNLTKADFGVLVALFLIGINNMLEGFIWKSSIYEHYHSTVCEHFTLTYNTGQFLWTVISVDGCVSVLFPIWYWCHHPTHLSTALCAFIWVISFFSLESTEHMYPFNISVLFCLPLMTVSTLILFFKVCFKSNQQKRGKVLTAILLALLFYLILAFPFTCIFFINGFLETSHINGAELSNVVLSCASLSSSINPLIYFLVGRRKRVRSRESMKIILQRVFKEEEEPREQL
ncbi:proto-oncogene Mas-like [Varanus komodoensis]|uniref:proto-oncogene Mas-like n=1 Tax=Varanus komodoensis TaxID=61221 RepID=UPI001CF7E668|nr:proto-oncogene Mas-like [Varanus komodoensis]XP_044308788.1 proto-oncogene Mas-like [Varanus komodoensis]